MTGNPCETEASWQGTCLILLLSASVMFSPSDIGAATAHPIADSTNCFIHPGLTISLFAKEPEVCDPVALNVNGLRWGLDNRVHGVNGGNGGSITSMRNPGRSTPLGYLDFSFDPRSGNFATTSHGSGGFGLVFDDWGRSFVTHNINHIQHRFI